MTPTLWLLTISNILRISISQSHIYCGDNIRWSPLYDRNCRPDVNGCSIRNVTAASFSEENNYPGYVKDSNISYYCFNQYLNYDAFENEIRVVGIYQSYLDQTVTINLKSLQDTPITKPVILLLTSEKSVNWFISSCIDNLEINTIQAISSEYINTTISFNVTNNITILNGYSVISPREYYDVTPQSIGNYSFYGLETSMGYGNDMVTGQTADMLYEIPSIHGDFAYSFIGSYETSSVDVYIGNQNITLDPSISRNINSDGKKCAEDDFFCAAKLCRPWIDSVSPYFTCGSVHADLHCSDSLMPIDRDDIYYSQAQCDPVIDRCVCADIPGYNYYTCLPDVNGCTMCSNWDNDIGDLDKSPAWFPGRITSSSVPLYSCLDSEHDYGSLENEIRVVGVYDASVFSVRNSIQINLRTCGEYYTNFSKPLIILLSNYEPINWYITSNDQYVIENIDILKIEAWAFEYETIPTNISYDESIFSNIETNVRTDKPYYGYGDDSGGGTTAKGLSEIPGEFGDYPYSFVGAYYPEAFDLCVGYQGDIRKYNIEPPPYNLTDGETDKGYNRHSLIFVWIVSVCFTFVL